MSLTAFDHGSVKITVIDSRELTKNDTWGSGVEYFYFMTQVNMQLGVHAVCYLLRCVVDRFML